jgi:hypothetical protein
MEAAENGSWYRTGKYLVWKGKTRKFLMMTPVYFSSFYWKKHKGKYSDGNEKQANFLDEDIQLLFYLLFFT